MRTVVLGPQPPELEALIARRRALGQDTHDEVWEGDYHMAPAAHGRHEWIAGEIHRALYDLVRGRGLYTIGTINVGTQRNLRVPDGAILREKPDQLYFATAAMVIEVLSPDDETWEKFTHYAAHGVDEILVAHPAEFTLALFVREGDGYRRSDASALLGVTVTDLHAMIDWLLDD